MVYLLIARMFSGIIIKLAFLAMILGGIGLILVASGVFDIPTLSDFAPTVSDFVQIPFSF